MKSTTRPNLVFILTDDQGYGEIGAHGNAYIKTPNLDQLHHKSIRFTNFHVGTTCAPTRAGLLTGHNCNSTGVWHTIGGRSLLRENEWTLANALQEAGYRTGHFGKWHLGDASPFLPHERGFELSISHGGGGIGNTPDYWGNDYFDDTYSVNGKPVKFEGFCADVFFSEGMKFIEQHKDENFFCYIASNTPHGPWNVEEHYWKPYAEVAPTENIARFYGTVGNVDENVGKLYQKLEELDLADNTIIVFMTDNGSGGGVTCDDQGHVEEGPCNFNAGMRGTKCWEYEGGHRVPFFLYLPDKSQHGGSDIKELTSYIDFMPTILDLCNVPVPEARSFHGRSLISLINGEQDAIWQERILVTDTQRVARPVMWRKSCVMQNNWRLVNGKELYDLASDPSQKNDIAAQHPAIVEQLRNGYQEWWNLVSEQFDRDIPFAIGDSDETVILTTHDIRNEGMICAWNQIHVRKGSTCHGYWEVDVRSEGRYSFELRRWPREANYPITAGIDGDDVEQRRDCYYIKGKDRYSGGEALPIKWARLQSGDQTFHAEIEPDATHVTFEVDLAVGGTHIFPSFHCDEPDNLAPYYIYIDKKQ
jgi:arylsulfatase A-like enzyme